jgi:copper chaperone CopZ
MEETITHHHIRFKECPAHLNNKQEEVISAVKGVRTVKIDKEKGDVFVEYNLNECMESDIEEAMVKMGFVLDNGFMQKLKRGYIHYTEENERENLHHKPSSCCDVDEIERKRKELK